MFIERCISFLLSATMFIEPYCVQAPSVKDDNTVTDTPTPVSVVEYAEEESEVIETVVEIVPSEPQLPLSDEDIDLIALVTMAEAEGEPEEGKRLVIDVILNQLDSPRFSDTVHGVVLAKNAFECISNGRINKCYVRDDIRQLVIEELISRTNYEVLYFRADRYHSFGTPVVSVGNHYFSTN